MDKETLDIAASLLEHVHYTGHKFTWMYNYLNAEEVEVSDILLDIVRTLQDDDITSLEEAIYLMIDTPSA